MNTDFCKLSEKIVVPWNGYLLVCILFFVFVFQAFSEEIKAKVVEIEVGKDSKMIGYLALPTGQGKMPAILLLHEWWGLNDWIKKNAESFAKNGYVALAIDLYEGTVAEDAELAHELMRALPTERAIRDMKAGVNYLKNLPHVNKSKIASIGWCMGGGYSLKLAIHEPLSATVICYGRLVTDEKMLEKIDGPILGIFGDLDRGISVKSVKQFEKSLTKLEKKNSIKIFKNVGHAFMNPSNKRGYQSVSANEAWDDVLGFFKKELMSE